MAQLLLSTVIIVAVVFWRSAEARAALRARLPQILSYTGLGLLALLVATGRLPWTLVLILAALLLLWRFGISRRCEPRGEESNCGAGDCCRLQTENLAITVDPHSGCIDGMILGDHRRGRRLSRLALADLLILHNAYLTLDPEAAALLRAYLDQAHSGWRGNAQYHENATHDPGGASALSDAQAYALLGLAHNAERAQIVTAHRRLMQRLHPDRGGSAYLAARLNEAKVQLLRGRPPRR